MPADSVLECAICGACWVGLLYILMLDSGCAEYGLVGRGSSIGQVQPPLVPGLQSLGRHYKVICTTKWSVAFVLDFKCLQRGYAAKWGFLPLAPGLELSDYSYNTSLNGFPLVMGLQLIGRTTVSVKVSLWLFGIVYLWECLQCKSRKSTICMVFAILWMNLKHKWSSHWKRLKPCKQVGWGGFSGNHQGAGIVLVRLMASMYLLLAFSGPAKWE